MTTCVFIAIVVVGLSRGRFSDQKGCCLSSKTREKNVCRGRMIDHSTEMARVAEVDRGNFELKRESERKSVNHARVHASAQSFDSCEGQNVFCKGKGKMDKKRRTWVGKLVVSN